jgi:BirA family biotin operon repressor/biotin-[acetyl-CoA-carboxylase] ligase
MNGSGDPERPRLPPAYRLVALESVESTNDEAWRLAEEGAEEGTLVWAREQTKGRGRRGRVWAGQPGNLYFSIVLRPEQPPSEAAQLSFIAALALAEAIGSVAPPLIEVEFKWPNDVLLNASKSAGILLEAKSGEGGLLDWLVLGVGVNVAGHPEDADFPATSLRYEGAEVTPAALLEAFGRHFMAWTRRWLDDGFAPARHAWLQHARGLGETIRVNLPHETLEGTFRDLDASGALVLELADGSTRTIAAGDVYFTD